MILVVFCQFSGTNTQDIGLPQQNSPPTLDFGAIQELVLVKSRSHFWMDWVIFRSLGGISMQICIINTYRKSKKSIMINIEPKINDMHP